MGNSKKRGRCARNARKALVNQEPEDLVKAPHSFVINRGILGKSAHQLMLNFRKIMEPYTASQLKVRRQNVLKDFVHIAGPLNVTHLVAFTKSEIGVYMSVSRLPRGPTLKFLVKEYCLSKDVVSSLKKAVIYEKLFENHPLMVLNNFSGNGLHFKLMTTMFQGMFPSINVNKANLNAIRRCLILNYNSDKTIDLRHYAIKITPCGLSKPVKKLIQNKVPDLGNYNDVSEFMDGGNYSESEVEIEGMTNEVILPQPISSRGNIASQKSAIRLYEIGPKMKLQLIKIEEGISCGNVLFHEFIKKTPEEIAAMEARQKAKKQLKDRRRAVQEANVKRKQSLKSKDGKTSDNVQDGEDGDAEDEDEDKAWYQQEVGCEPDKDFENMTKKRKQSTSGGGPAKKVRFSKQENSEKSPKEDKDNLQSFLERKRKRKMAKQKKKRAQKKSVKSRSKKK